MLEELERRNYAASTTRACLRAVDEYARYFNRPLGPDHIRQYQAYLFRERKLQPFTVIQHLGGIRFFYIRTLKQSWSADLTPYPRKVIHLPSILSREEVNSLIEAAPTPFQRTLLMALYATGLRRAELARLKITDTVAVSHFRASGRESCGLAVAFRRFSERWRYLAQGDLAGLQRSGRTCRYPKRGPSSYPAALLRYSLTGRRRGPADYPDSARTPRSGRDHDLSQLAPETCRLAVSRQPLAHRRSSYSRCHGRPLRWPTSSAQPGRAFSKTAESGLPGYISKC